jgi:hypothetical protein
MSRRIDILDGNVRRAIGASIAICRRGQQSIDGGKLLALPCQPALT